VNNEKKIRQGFDRPCRTSAGTNRHVVTVLPSRSQLCEAVTQQTVLYSAGADKCKAHNEISLMQCNEGNKLGAIFTVVPCVLILSKSFIYQLMHNRVALKEY
jgi:hypothetical protein